MSASGGRRASRGRGPAATYSWGDVLAYGLEEGDEVSVEVVFALRPNLEPTRQLVRHKVELIEQTYRGEEGRPPDVLTLGTIPS